MRKKMKKKGITIIMGIIFLGAIWGILEASMGNVLHWIGLHPFTGAIMTSIGLGLLSFGRTLYRKRGSGIIMGIVAAAIKAIDFLIPGSNVLRPIIAILLVSLAFEAIVIVTEKLKETNLLQLAKGLVAGYISIASFAYFTAYILHFKYWLSMGFVGILKYIITDGWMFGLGGAALMWAGHHLVNWSNKSFKLEQVVQTGPYYRVSVAGTFILILLAALV